MCNVRFSIGLSHSEMFTIKTTKTNERSEEEKESNRRIFIKGKRRSLDKGNYWIFAKKQEELINNTS